MCSPLPVEWGLSPSTKEARADRTCDTQLPCCQCYLSLCSYLAPLVFLSPRCWPYWSCRTQFNLDIIETEEIWTLASCSPHFPHLTQPPVHRPRGWRFSEEQGKMPILGCTTRVASAVCQPEPTLNLSLGPSGEWRWANSVSSRDWWLCQEGILIDKTSSESNLYSHPETQTMFFSPVALVRIPKKREDESLAWFHAPPTPLVWRQNEPKVFVFMDCDFKYFTRSKLL